MGEIVKLRTVVVKPPNKETCLRMAELCSESNSAQRMMWDWLFCWGFYEHWIETYWSKE